MCGDGIYTSSHGRAWAISWAFHGLWHFYLIKERCNSIVLSWLLNSVSDDLFLGQIFSDNAAEVWAELKKTYNKLDGSIIFNLLQKIHGFKQEDVLKHNQLIKLMQFLMGLNEVFQPIKSSLLSRESLPDVKDVIVIISKEESRRGIAFSSSSSGKVGHTVDICFDLIGYPLGYKKNPGPKKNGYNKTFNANSASTSNDSGTSLSFTNEQIIKLMNLINDVAYGTGQANMADLLPVVMYCDNSLALQIAANPMFHEKSKHFKIDAHLIREKVASGVIKTEKIHTSQQIADVLTKALDI
nr:hypothetical protein [Tanacetum cinerariifolium]